jgi:hypothetical protein
MSCAPPLSWRRLCFSIFVFLRRHSAGTRQRRREGGPLAMGEVTSAKRQWPGANGVRYAALTALGAEDSRDGRERVGEFQTTHALPATPSAGAKTQRHHGAKPSGGS